MSKILAMHQDGWKQIVYVWADEDAVQWDEGQQANVPIAAFVLRKVFNPMVDDMGATSPEDFVARAQQAALDETLTVGEAIAQQLTERGAWPYRNPDGATLEILPEQYRNPRPQEA